MFLCDALDSLISDDNLINDIAHEKLKLERTAESQYSEFVVCLSYLSVDLFVVVVVLVDLEVDLRGRDGDLSGHRHSRGHQHGRRAYVDRP